MRCRWPNNCFVRCCFQNLFNIARGILVQFLSSFSQYTQVIVHVVHLYSRNEITVAWEILRFLISDWSNFHIIDNLSIAVHAFARRILMSFSVDETLVPSQVNLSTNFKELPLRVEMSPFWLKHILHFVGIHMEANASYCLLQAV